MYGVCTVLQRTLARSSRHAFRSSIVPETAVLTVVYMWSAAKITIFGCDKAGLPLMCQATKTAAGNANCSPDKPT